MMPEAAPWGRVRLMDWARILAYVTGMVDQKLLARNEYLAAENRILRAQLKGRLRDLAPARNDLLMHDLRPGP